MKISFLSGELKFLIYYTAELAVLQVIPYILSAILSLYTKSEDFFAVSLFILYA